MLHFVDKFDLRSPQKIYSTLNIVTYQYKRAHEHIYHLYLN